MLVPRHHNRHLSAAKQKESSSYKIRRIQTLKGIVELKWVISTESDFSAKYLSVDIEIRPEPELSSKLVQVHMIKEWRPEFPAPRIERLIQAWNRQPFLNSDLETCLLTDDLDGFRRLLITGQACIYDRYAEGTLVDFAVGTYSSKILEFLSSLDSHLYDEFFDLPPPDEDYGTPGASWLLLDGGFFRTCIVKLDDEDSEDQLAYEICKIWDILYSRYTESAKAALLQFSLCCLKVVTGGLVSEPFTITPKIEQHFLDRGCDPNGFHWNGYTPSDLAYLGGRLELSRWEKMLASCGYRLCKMINGRDVICLAVSADSSSLQPCIDVKTDKLLLDKKLPVTGWTIKEWIERRFLLRKREFIGSYSLWPIKAEELNTLGEVDWETVVQGAFSNIPDEDYWTFFSSLFSDKDL